MKPRIRKTILLALATLVLGGISFLVSRAHRAKAETAVVRPFTAVIVERRYPSDPSASEAQWPNTELLIHAVRSDGSTSEVARRLDPNGQWVEMRSVVDAGSRRRVAIDPMTDSVTTYQLQQSALPTWNQLSATCQKNGLEHSRRLGYDVVRVDDNSEGPGGSSQNWESWRAPALACFPMYESASPDLSGDPTVRTTREVAFITEGEPSADLFGIPPDYVERSPSQVLAEFQSRFPNLSKHCQECAMSSGPALDKAYNIQRSRQ